MATTVYQIRKWFDEGKANGYTHMMVMCDTYDYEDYPKYVKGSSEYARRMAREYASYPMTRLMEVYNLTLDGEPQFKEYRAYNY
jgi:hypothetical protein